MIFAKFLQKTDVQYKRELLESDIKINSVFAS